MTEGIYLVDAIEVVWDHMSMLREKGCTQVEGEITSVCGEIVYASVRLVAPKPADFITLNFKVNDD